MRVSKTIAPILIALFVLAATCLSGCNASGRSTEHTQLDISQSEVARFEEENAELNNRVDDLERQSDSLKDQVAYLEEELSIKNLAIEEREETVHMLERVLSESGGSYWYEYQWAYE